MKVQKLIWGILLLTTVYSSCSKNDDIEIETVLPQYPMKTLIESGHMQLKQTMPNWVNHFEVGYRFKTFKEGKITALGIRVPENDDLRVTLWNADTEEIIKTQIIISTSGLLSFEDIEPLDIKSGVPYFISVNTNSYYIFNGGGNAIFPVESGDLLITDYGVRPGTNPDQIMPTQYSKTSYIGMVDIKFVPNN